jgi:DNA-binding Lrp family transcriptional regulator
MKEPPRLTCRQHPVYGTPPSAIGHRPSAIVFVTLRESTKESVAAFEKALHGIRKITDVQRLFGDPDYMVHVVTRDLGVFQQFYDEALSALPSVRRLRFTPVMKSIFQNRSLPI